jgi:hypothetical protein
MKTKATHSGECQLCGRKQKLPKGHLSLHGYTKEWGFFNGTCTGSRHKPYEESCDQITFRIPHMVQLIADQTQEIEKLTRQTLPVDGVWVKQYSRKTGRYTWKITEVRNDPVTGWSQYKDDRGQWLTQKHDHTDALVVFTALWVEELKRQRAETRRYLKWLEDRRDNWTPKPLNPLEAN